MDDRQDAILTIGLLCGILLFLVAADLWTDDRIYSENENRLLASEPEYSTDAVLAGTYMDDLETYLVDQFVGRDNWIEIRNRIERLLQKEEINGVYLGEDGYLFEQHLDTDFDEDTIEKKIELLGELSDTYNAWVMLIPTADAVLSDKLPEDAPSFDQEAFLEKVKDAVSEELYIDVASVLAEHKEEEIFYKTDTHWTTLGAYYAYQTWAEFSGRLSPVHFDVEGLVTVSEDFQGSLQSLLNLPAEGDSISYFPETLLRPVTVTYDGTKVRDSLYEDSYLEVKNQYGYFLDGDHAFVEIETGYENGRTLFVVKDSYANCMIPLLTVHYEKIYLVDLQYYSGRVSSLLEEYVDADTDVMVLYDCISFIENFRYY